MAKKNKDKDKKPPKPLQEELHETAALRLKIFIDDIMRDPMFKHRIFYPILYKEIVRGSEYVKRNKDKPDEVKAPIEMVIYEYYLLKAEKFSHENAAKIFQAILYANGPMLPERERFRITDANDPNSLLNPRNVDTVIHRTKIFLEVLQDTNLFKFVFMSTVGGNLDNMRQRFSELVRNINSYTGRDIAASRIDREVERNLVSFRQYFEHISTSDIRSVMNFLIYMGNPRNIVTDFSYRPMPQDMLDRFLDYNLSTEDEQFLNFRLQLEQALDSNVLEKDLVSQLDVFIPMLLKSYVSICKEDADYICQSYNKFEPDLSRELKNILKVKLQRSIKMIHDYTRNYITRKLLDDHYNDRLFISRVLNRFLAAIRNRRNESIATITRDVITYPNFVGSENDDLADLIKNIFRNDVSYIYQVCANAENCRETQASFTHYWDLTRNFDENLILNQARSYYDSVRNNIQSLIKVTTSLIDSIINEIKNIIDNLNSSTLFKSSSATSSPSSSSDKGILNKLKNVINSLKDSVDKFPGSSIENSLVEIIKKAAESLYGVKFSHEEIKRLLKFILNNSASDIDDLISEARGGVRRQLNNILAASDDTAAEKLAKQFWKNISSLYHMFVKNNIDYAPIADFIIAYAILAETNELFNYVPSSYADLVNHLKRIEQISNMLADAQKFFNNESVIKMFMIFDILEKLEALSDVRSIKELKELLDEIKNSDGFIKRNYERFLKDALNNMIPSIINNIRNLVDYFPETPQEFYVKIFHENIRHHPPRDRMINNELLAEYLLQLYFKYYLKPVLINFFGYALDNFEYTSRKDQYEEDIVSKDVLHFSKLLTPRTVGLFTFDGASIQDLAKFTYILTSDTFSGITYTDPDSVIKFLDNVYGLKYFNVIIYGVNNAYVYLNNIGTPYLYRGAKTKIPIRDLRKNYEFLMDPTRGLYKNIKLPKKKK